MLAMISLLFSNGCRFGVAVTRWSRST